MQRSVRVVDELESDNAANQTDDEQHLEDRGWFATEYHRPYDSEGSADTNPDSVGGTNGNISHRPGQPAHAQNKRNPKYYGRPKLGERF